jgi:uncharacterized membrane protein YkoI
MKRPHPISVILSVLALTAAGSFANARAHDDERRGKRSRERQEQAERPRARLSLDQAVAMAERRFNARVVRAEARERDGHVVYVLRLLNDAGRVWSVRIDAASGSMN